MKILYLQPEEKDRDDVADTLHGMGCGLTCLPIPRKDARQREEYAAGLLAAIEEDRPDFILSQGYYPEVSIVCQAAGIRYAAWITSAYDPQLYSCTLLNPCNHIFLADYSLYEKFVSEDFPHLSYLPLGAHTGWIGQAPGIPNRTGKYEADLLLPLPILPREDLGYSPLSPESPLKDATKGYLEGCIACQHQLSGLPSMAGQLPPYVSEDLAAHFPPVKSADSIEPASDYYDHRFFYPLITHADRDVHLETIRKNPHFQTVWQNNEWDHGELLRRAALSRINLIIVHRSWRSGIPQICWDIMAAGGFLLCNAQEDFFRLFPERPPVLYEDEWNMLSKAIFYLHHEEERTALTKELSEKVREKHTCRHRLQELCSRL